MKPWQVLLPFVAVLVAAVIGALGFLLWRRYEEDRAAPADPGAPAVPVADRARRDDRDRSGNAAVSLQRRDQLTSCARERPATLMNSRDQAPGNRKHTRAPSSRTAQTWLPSTDTRWYAPGTSMVTAPA